MAYKVNKVVLKWEGPKVSRRLNAGVKRGVEEAARLIVQEAIRSILHDPKTGRIYGGHQASAPGEAPANQYGELVSGFTIEMKGNRAIIRNRSPHAILLELGTSRMAPRPFLLPAMVKMQRVAQRTIARAIQHELKGK